MRVLASPLELTEAFDDLLSKSTDVLIATAWARKGDIIDTLIETKAAMQAVVGTAMNRTTPDVLERLDDRCALRIVEDDGDGLFHPKMYLFEDAASGWREAVVGSPNLTGAAFDRNEEVAVRFTPNDDAWGTLKALFTRYWDMGIPLEPAWLEAYRELYDEAEERRKSARDEQKKRVRSARRGRTSGPTVTVGGLLTAEWPEYLAMLRTRVREEQGDESVIDRDENSYLHTLRRTKPLAVKQFSSLTESDRRILLGISDPFGFFGRLNVARRFYPMLLTGENRNAIAKIDQLSQRIDEQSPAEDAVHYAELFFNELTAEWGLKEGFATRLQALKRPDLFFSLNNKSRRKLQDMFRTIKDPLSTWDGYLACLRLIWKSPWFKSRKPNDKKQAELWSARVALIDAYVYDPRGDTE